MPNITLSVDEDVIKKVRKVAIDKNTTLTAMVREFLISIANLESQNRKEYIRKLQASFETMSRDMGERRWTREALYER